MQVVLNIFVGIDVLQCLGVPALQALEELHGGVLFLSWTQVPGVRRSGDDGEREDEYRCSGQHVFSSCLRAATAPETAPQMLAHGEAFSPASVPCARVSARVLRKSIRAASSHAAPTQPRSVTVACMSVNPPTAAPSEKPRYMKDALSERTIGASVTPTIWIKPVCCAGKNAKADNPHAIIASKTGGSAIAGGSTCATVDRPASANASTQRLVRMTARAPSLSVALPPMITPTPAEAPHRKSAYPTCGPRSGVAVARNEAMNE